MLGISPAIFGRDNPIAALYANEAAQRAGGALRMSELQPQLIQRALSELADRRAATDELIARAKAERSAQVARLFSGAVDSGIRSAETRRDRDARTDFNFADLAQRASDAKLDRENRAAEAQANRDNQIDVANIYADARVDAAGKRKGGESFGATIEALDQERAKAAIEGNTAKVALIDAEMQRRARQVYGAASTPEEQATVAAQLKQIGIDVTAPPAAAAPVATPAGPQRSWQQFGREVGFFPQALLETIGAGTEAAGEGMNSFFSGLLGTGNAAPQAATSMPASGPFSMEDFYNSIERLPTPTSMPAVAPEADPYGGIDWLRMGQERRRRGY